MTTITEMLTTDPDVRNAVWDMTDGRCARCRVAMSPVRGRPTSFEVDHIIPRSRGGINHISNYQPLCRACNGPGGKGTNILDYRSWVEVDDDEMSEAQRERLDDAKYEAERAAREDRHLALEAACGAACRAAEDAAFREAADRSDAMEALGFDYWVWARILDTIKPVDFGAIIESFSDEQERNESVVNYRPGEWADIARKENI